MRRLFACAVVLISVSASSGTPTGLLERPWQWQTEQGETAQLSQWRGSPMIVSMVFTSCESRCPLTIAKLKSIEQALRRAGVVAQFALVTLDPGKDTPKRLAAYKREHRLPETWHLLSGSREATYELNRALAVNASPPDGHIDHEVRIMAVTPDGALAQSFSGWSFDDAAVVQALTSPGQ
jgi:protein SCO1/2